MKFFRALFSSNSHSVRHASALLAITALLSNILGLGRNLIFYRLIVPEQLDVYFASFRIADFLFNLLIFGTIISAFIPVISELIAHKKEAEAQKITNQLLSWATLFFVILGLLLCAAMPTVITWVVPGFDPIRLETTVFLSRLMLIQTVFFSWSFILGGLLNANRRFTSYAVAPLVYNSSIIIGGIAASRLGIKAITYAVIIGAFLHFSLQLREAKRIGFRFKWDLQFTPKIREIISLMIPRSLSQGMAQLVLIVYTSLASGLQAGSIAIFSGMNDLQTTPTVIIGNSLATAILPALAGFATHNEWEKMGNLLDKTIRSALFLLMPTIALGFILRAQIVRLYFGIGGASWLLTDIAIHTFVWFLVGIIPACIVAILARVFYALKDTRTPMLVSILSGALAVMVAFIGITVYHTDVSSLALAESLISVTQALAYILILSRRADLHFPLSHLFHSLLNYGLGSVLMAAGSWVTLYLIDNLYRLTGLLSTDRVPGLLLQSILAALVGALLYLGYSKLRNPQELAWIRTKNFILKQP